MNAKWLRTRQDDELAELRIEALQRRDDLKRDLNCLPLPRAIQVKVQANIFAEEMKIADIEEEMRRRGDEPMQYEEVHF
jgi:hypothetical protein